MECENKFSRFIVRTNFSQKLKAIVQKAKKNLMPEIIFRDGKPVRIILSITKYQEILERLEDIEDLKILEKMRKKTLKFRKLEDFLGGKK